MRYVVERERLLAEAAAALKVQPAELPGRIAGAGRGAPRAGARAERCPPAPRPGGASGGKSANGDGAGRGRPSPPGCSTACRPSELKSMADDLKKQIGSGVVAIVARSEGRAAIVVAVTDDLKARFDARELVPAGGAALGGQGGGGRPDMAQAGGPDAEQGPAALAAIEQAVRAAGGGLITRPGPREARSGRDAAPPICRAEHGGVPAAGVGIVTTMLLVWPSPAAVASRHLSTRSPTSAPATAPAAGIVPAPRYRHLRGRISAASVERRRPGAPMRRPSAGAALDYALSSLGIVDLLVVLPSRSWAWPGRAGGSSAIWRPAGRSSSWRATCPGARPGARGVAQRSARSLLAALTVLLVLLVLASGVMYVLEHDAQPQVFSSIPATHVVVASSPSPAVGYGDMTPITPAGRIFARHGHHAAGHRHVRGAGRHPRHRLRRARSAGAISSSPGTPWPGCRSSPGSMPRGSRPSPAC